MALRVGDARPPLRQRQASEGYRAQCTATPPRAHGPRLLRQGGAAATSAGSLRLRSGEFSWKDVCVATACVRHSHRGDGGHVREVYATRETPRAELVAQRTCCHASRARFIRTFLPLWARSPRSGTHCARATCVSASQGPTWIKPTPAPCSLGTTARVPGATRQESGRLCPDTCPAPMANEAPTDPCAAAGGPPHIIPEHSRALLPRGPRPTVLSRLGRPFRGPFLKHPFV